MPGRVIHYEAAFLLQSGTKNFVLNEFSNAHELLLRLRMDFTSLSVLSVRAVIAASFHSVRVATPKRTHAGTWG